MQSSYYTHSSSNHKHCSCVVCCPPALQAGVSFSLTVSSVPPSQAYTLAVRPRGDTHTRVSRGSEPITIPRYLVYSIKRLPMPKVNKLQSRKLRLTQSLLVATFTQNFMRFRCTVMEKRHQNFPPHSSVCDDLYHACTFAWDKLCTLFTPH